MTCRWMLERLAEDRLSMVHWGAGQLEREGEVCSPEQSVEELLALAPSFRVNP